VGSVFRLLYDSVMLGAMDPFETVASLSRGIRSGQWSPVEIAEFFLDRIDRLDPALHSFLDVTRERALAEARAAEVARKSGQTLGPLHGVPYSVKDLFDVRGHATTAGTRLLARNISESDCAVVRGLSAAGMVLLGKQHTVQFAFGMVGSNRDYGAPHNPWRREAHAPGGSSSGGAVAVAAGLAPASLGTDTGGSVRLPAALCGIVGLKTTVGRVSRAGVYPLSRHLDSVGPLARTVEDAALLYQAISGSDPADESTRGLGPDDVLHGLEDGVRGLRIAFGETLFFDDVEHETAKAVRAAGDVFRSLGASVESKVVPEVAEAWKEPNRGIFVAAEACSENRALLDDHMDELDPFVAQRMILGRKLSGVDAFTLLRRFAALRQEILGTLRDLDALLVPAAMDVARPLGDVTTSLETYLDYNLRLNRNAGLGNILNLCGVSIPCGFTTAGLPVGLLIYAKPFQEATALRVARAYERATTWHERRPDLAWALEASGAGSKPGPGSSQPAKQR